VNYLRTPYHTYLPLRQDTLIWDSSVVRETGPQRALLPDVTIFRLLDHGCRVDIVDPEDHEFPMAVVWEATNDTYKKYIVFFGKIKADEDAKLKEERNPAQREFGKMGLNSQSEKPGQKTFDIRNIIYTIEQVEKARAKIKEGIEQKDPLKPYLVAQNFMMVKQHKKRVTRYPVQISDFIYAYARDYMWVELFSRSHKFNSRVLGSDTDSGVITEAQLNDLCDRNKLVNTEKEFGLFEVEAVIDKFAYGGPKFYCANKIDGDQTGGRKNLELKEFEPLIKSSWMVLNIL
jgi:hypothetical protein